jgi:hypothetical protein
VPLVAVRGLLERAGMPSQKLIRPGVSRRGLALALTSLAVVVGDVDLARAAPPMATTARASGPPGTVPARAVPPPAVEPDLLVERPWVLAVHLALAAPAGSLAAELERNLVPWLSASIGGGFALGGPQLAGMLRLRLPWAPGRSIGIGAGASHGDYKEVTFGIDIPNGRRGVVWGNVEAFLDGRTRDGFYARLYLGHSITLHRGTPAVQGDDLVYLPTKLPYIGLAGGVCF